MPNNFRFIGKIQGIKDSEKFHPIERKTFNSGWAQTTVKFNVISNGNRIMCLSQGGKWSKDEKNIIHTFTKTTTDANGNVIKGTKIDIAWDKRFDPKEIDKVAGFRRYIVDLGDKQERSVLINAVKAFEEGKITDALRAETKCNTLEQAKEALEKSNKRRHIFLSEWDFAEFMTKVIASDKMKDVLFLISGVQEIQYNPEKGRFYVNYRVNKVELAKEELKPDTNMFIDFYFSENCVDDSDFAENGKGYLNGYTTYYDNNVKSNGFMPITIVVRDEKKLGGIKRKLSAEGDAIKNISLVVNVIDGTEMTAITYDDLDDDTKADIECGFYSVEDAIKSLNNNKAGDKVTELRLVGPNPKKNKVEDTTFTTEDMTPAKAIVEGNDDLMDDEDDDIL